MNDQFPEIAEALEREPTDDFVLDGEVVAMRDGVSSFEPAPAAPPAAGAGLLLRLRPPAPRRRGPAALPLRERKARLRRALEFQGPIRFNPHRNGEHGEELFREACQKGLEGVIAKRADSPYTGTRSRDWLKLKCHAEQELVIGGFTAPKGSRTDFGALLVGYNEDGALRYAGQGGTGFDHATLRELGARLRELEQDESPFPPFKPIPRARAGCGRSWWLRSASRSGPATGACATRATSGLRDDKPASRCGARGAVVSTVEITHPDKVLFPDDGITKADLAGYYERVSEWMLPHVRLRPISMQRFPDGIGGKGFFHKDIPDYFPAWLKRVEVPKSGGTVTHVYACDADTLVYLVGQNTITPHVWLSRADRPWQPDRMVIDLDPPPGSDFDAVRRAARHTRRAAARARARAVRPGHRLEGHPRVDAAAPPRRPRRDPRARARHRPRARATGTPTSSRASGARRSATAASWWTPRATPTRRRLCRPTRSARAPARRWPRRSTGTSCPTRSFARTAGR